MYGLVLAGAALIIHSCRKDNRFTSLSAADSVNKAKTWYESAYPANGSLNSLNSKLPTQGINTPASSTIDYSQYIKPDWQHPANYKRFNKAVIEMPVDASANMLFALKNNSTGQLVYNK